MNNRYKICAALLICFLFLGNRSLFSQIDHWETVVNANSSWKYFRGISEPASAWRQLTYNDAAWLSGTGGVGFGDSDDGTTIATASSVYLRKSFTITDTSKISMMLLNMDYDDGFIAYINDVEVARANLGSIKGDLPPYNQFANDQHEATMYTGWPPEGFILSKAILKSCLVNGANMLAITVHNATASSPDLSSNAWLHAAMTIPGTFYGVNPSWFKDPIYSSNLPLILIETNGQDVVDSLSKTARMGIIDNGPGMRNYITDSFNDYDGYISIEIRGSTSQQYPKKSYGVETQDSLGNNNNVSILGMPKENDWVFYAPYPDKTLMRNTLAYDLFRKMGHYESNTRFCELIINGEYRGVYEIHEKVKIDSRRLDIPKITPTDISGDALTGGYIVKIDKITSGGTLAWTSPFSSKVWYQHHDPTSDELVPAQETYIQTFFNNFETAVSGPGFADPVNGYRKYIDVQSFMDFMLMQEMGRTVDGYRSSSFFHKQRDSYGGKISAGPMWDFNLSFGNADYCEAFNTVGWQYEFNTICSGYNPEVPYFWDRLMDDSRYRNEIYCRWTDLRLDLLSTTRIHSFIDSLALLLDESKTRNFERWPILGVYVNWNYYVGPDYPSEINWLKTWLSNRFTWMDSGWPSPLPPIVCNTPNADYIRVTEINYHSDSLKDAGDWFELMNVGSASVDLSEWRFKDNNHDNLFTFPIGTTILPGEYLVLCEDTTKFKSRHPLVTNFLGPFGFGFDNDGEGIRLFDAYYSEVLSMSFEDNTPWPITPDGGGYTLEVLDSLGDMSDPANWFAGCPEGSPGEAYTAWCITSSENFLTDHSGFMVVPNPFQEKFEVRFDDHFLEKNGEVRIVVSDMSGRILKQFSVEGNAKIFSIDASDFASGLYFLNVISKEAPMGVRKIVKM